MSGQSVAAYMDKASSSRNVGLPTHGILGLPVEIQDAIIAHASVRARFRLQRVSQHFHDRASRVIWRKLQFQLTPAVFPNLKFPGMRMIEALRAVSTSQHNYAQYIHIFDVEVVPDDGIQGANNELLVAHRFLPESDAQKLLSLSLFLLLHKAIHLEIFRWQAPVELDTACWKLLASISSLRILLVHIDARSSVYVGRTGTNLSLTNLPYQHISGCTSLSRLSLGRIDDMNHLDHIAACIRGSSGTLKSLRLTFSSALAAKAKKAASSNPIPPPPPVGMQLEDMDATSDEDEDLTPPPEVSPQEDPGVIKQHRNVQENALARILSVDIDDTSQKVDRALVNSALLMISTESKVDADGAKNMHELVDKIIAGGKLDSDEARTLEQLRNKLNSASVSRSSKRQKPSSSQHKTKNKGLKSSTALQQAYGAAYSVPKSSTSSASNPWANPYPVGSSLPPVFSPSGYSNSNPFSSPPPIAYSPVLPPGPIPGTAPQGNWAIPSATAPAEALDLIANDHSYAEGDMSMYLTMPGGSTGKANISDYKKWVDALAPSGQLSLSQMAQLSAVPSAMGHVPSKADAELVNELVKKILKLTALKGPPPPPAFSVGPTKYKIGIKKKKKPPANFAAAYDEDSESNDSSESPADDNASGSTSTPPEKSNVDDQKTIEYDDMGVDIVHPDNIEGDSGDEQQLGADDQDDAPRSLKDKGKGKAVVATDVATPTTRSVSPGKRSRDVSEIETKEISADQAMREWIRKEHGLALQRLQLYLVPLKASVLGRAVQLHSLERITLLSVGGQGPFWQLMCKAQEDRPLALRDIHTDDVSASFLHCASKLKTLSTLILLRRNKANKDNTTTKDPASIEEIRKLVVQPHIDNLHTLVIDNQHDQSWCLTQAFIALLCARGANLKLLSFQCSTTRFVEFTSATDFFVMSGKGKAKLKLANLEALHYLGVGTNTPASHTGTADSIGANGDPVDTIHDFIARDNYKGCRTQLQLWAKRRRSYGDMTLKYIAVVTNAFEIGATSTSKDVPKWLQDDYERAQNQSRQARADTDGAADADLTLEQWAVQNNYERWTKQRFTEVKAVRLPAMKHIRIFNKATRYGTL